MVIRLPWVGRPCPAAAPFSAMRRQACNCRAPRPRHPAGRVPHTTAAAAAGGEMEGAPPAATGSPAPAAASFLGNPVIAQREMLRRFYMAPTWEEQMSVVQTSTAHLDVGARCCSLLGGTASCGVPPPVSRRWGRPGHAATCKLAARACPRSRAQRPNKPTSIEAQDARCCPPSNGRFLTLPPGASFPLPNALMCIN
jgi:hypothetical protein